jgi:hypothetical protein
VTIVPDLASILSRFCRFRRGLDAPHPPLSSLRRQGPITTGLRCDTWSELQLAQQTRAGGFGSRRSPGRRGECVRRDSASSRHDMSELLKATRPRKREGAGKVGCPPHPWSACRKKHAAEPQVQAEPPAFPARWFYGLYAISPVTSLVATVARETRKRLHDLSACIGAPGPRDFAVRTHAARRAKIAPGNVRPSHPAPNVRDDREPPLFSGAGWARASF